MMCLNDYPGASPGVDHRLMKVTEPHKVDMHV